MSLGFAGERFPKQTFDKMVNFRDTIRRYSWLTVAIRYPPGASVTVRERVWKQPTDRAVNSLDVIALGAFNAYNTGATYYQDRRTGYII